MQDSKIKARLLQILVVGLFCIGVILSFRAGQVSNELTRLRFDISYFRMLHNLIESGETNRLEEYVDMYRRSSSRVYDDYQNRWYYSLVPTAEYNESNVEEYHEEALKMPVQPNAHASELELTNAVPPKREE